MRSFSILITQSGKTLFTGNISTEGNDIGALILIEEAVNANSMYRMHISENDETENVSSDERERLQSQADSIDVTRTGDPADAKGDEYAD